METKTVFITGTSSGIGHAFVKYFVEKNYLVYAGVRKIEDGAELQKGISPKIVPLICDITDMHSIESAVGHIGTRLDVLVNNAGVSYGGPIEGVDLDEVRRLFEVNVFGQIAVIQKALPLLRETKGFIINVASIAGVVAQPYLAPYCASKAAFDFFSVALRSELKQFGIKVAIIAPSAVNTPIWDKSRSLIDTVVPKLSPRVAELYRSAIANFSRLLEKEHRRAVHVDEVVAALHKILSHDCPDIHYYVGQDAKSGSLAKKVLPEGFFYKIVEKRFNIPS